MKQLSLILITSVLFFSCNKTNNDEALTSNKVVLLKVDYLTNKFEGGKEINFPEAPSFTISTVYNSPGDFGSIALYYEELNEKLFEGTIIWMGTGEMSYPLKIDNPNKFSKTRNNLPLPAEEMFEYVQYNDFSYYSDNIDYGSLWNAIKNLKIVTTYRASNSNSKIFLFLYTPSVGVGDPAEWDWFVILKN